LIAQSVSGESERQVLVVKLKVLGPLILEAGGEEVSLGPLQRALLLVLLLGQGRYVPAMRLTEFLWGEEGGRVAATLRSHIAHLRRALDGSGNAAPYGSSRLMTERMASGTAYALRIEPECLDMTSFESLITAGQDHMDRGRCREASASFTSALSLWRGTPFADISERSLALAEVTRLEALQRLARSLRVEAEISLGRHREMTGELQSMLASWPDDEGLRELLAVCLARAGRVSEATQVCREGVSFALSQGLDPGSMERLQQSLLGRLQEQRDARPLLHGRVKAAYQT
jgi:DNA-binding SARP family transcriptional activator